MLVSKLCFLPRSTEGYSCEFDPSLLPDLLSTNLLTLSNPFHLGHQVWALDMIKSCQGSNPASTYIPLVLAPNAPLHSFCWPRSFQHPKNQQTDLWGNGLQYLWRYPPLVGAGAPTFLWPGWDPSRLASSRKSCEGCGLDLRLSDQSWVKRMKIKRNRNHHPERSRGPTRSTIAVQQHKVTPSKHVTKPEVHL